MAAVAAAGAAASSSVALSEGGGGKMAEAVGGVAAVGGAGAGGMMPPSNGAGNGVGNGVPKRCEKLHCVPRGVVARTVQAPEGMRSEGGPFNASPLPFEGPQVEESVKEWRLNRRERWQLVVCGRMEPL